MKKFLQTILPFFIATSMTNHSFVEEYETFGILTSKGPAWIEVLVEGKKKPQRYRPRWTGGMPSDGGGFDQDMLKKIKQLITTNRVRLKWKFNEHLRVLDIHMIIPAKKTGMTSGIIVARGKSWVDVQPLKGPRERYLPHWIGGMPSEGGGLDQRMLKKLKPFKVGDKVNISWEYSERKRVINIMIQP